MYVIIILFVTTEHVECVTYKSAFKLKKISLCVVDFKLIDQFYVMCMYVCMYALPLFISVYYTYDLCPWKPEECTSFPVTGISNDCDPRPG